MHSALSGTACSIVRARPPKGKKVLVGGDGEPGQRMQASCAREFIPRLRRPASIRKKQLLGDEMRHLRAHAFIKSMEVSGVLSWCFHLIRTMHTQADISVPAC